MFLDDLQKLGMTAYRFDLPPNTFARPEDENTEECFIQPDVPPLPSGLTDVSPCYYGIRNNLITVPSLLQFVCLLLISRPKQFLSFDNIFFNHRLCLIRM